MDRQGFTFANPGSLRMAKTVAIGGGVSDPRNGIVLKIFSLINYGERAGSGLNSIFHVWEHVYHTPAEINEEIGVDRVTVTLPNGGHEQDVKAMLELYDNPEELMFPEDGKLYGQEGDMQNDQNVDKLVIKQLIIAKSADKVPTNALNVPVNVDNSIQSVDKVSITDEMADKLADIVIYLKNHPKSPSSSIATLIGLGDTSAKNYLRRLVSFGLVKAEGANKNRTYSAI